MGRDVRADHQPVRAGPGPARRLLETCLLPGGAVDKGESPAHAAARELGEELGITAAPNQGLAKPNPEQVSVSALDCGWRSSWYLLPSIGQDQGDAAQPLAVLRILPVSGVRQESREAFARKKRAWLEADGSIGRAPSNEATNANPSPVDERQQDRGEIRSRTGGKWIGQVTPDSGQDVDLGGIAHESALCGGQLVRGGVSHPWIISAHDSCCWKGATSPAERTAGSPGAPTRKVSRLTGHSFSGAAARWQRQMSAAVR
ncbi:NUDIX hydrolase [Streptomyces sp. NPDC087317]|uniref:NUDIX hydrolase n=1 Tax=Streptomyces sp. NPDC087317 TaxID=3365784 RepID=UPI00380B82A4